VGGAGGRLDPCAVVVDDLSRSYNDPLLAQVRKRLRKQYGFPRDKRRRFKVDCVYSPEEVRYPQPDGSVCTTRHIAGKMRLDCESGFGTATFITGAFGFAAAARICNRLAAADA
jgi:tRNA threonylcarbamoyladenosine dehydratase